MRSWLVGLAVVAGVTVAIWGVLALLGRRLPKGLLRDLAAFIPDCVTTVRRLRKDPRVPRRAKIALLVAALWVASPIDLIPEFLPVIGALDDVIVVALALRYTTRQVPREAILAAWPGEPRLLERLSGINRNASPTGDGAASTPARDVVPFGQAVRTWFAISLQTFGGPASQIAIMQRKLVEEKRWIGQRRFLHALNYCMLLPGPEAQQLATYVGWLLNGVRGGLVAGTLFVLPGVVALLALSGIYVAFGDTPGVTALFAGLAPAVLAIVAQAVLRVGRRALHHPGLVALAVTAFAALALFGVPFPIVVAAAAVAGWGLSRVSPHAVRHPEDGDADGPGSLIPDDALHDEHPTLARAARILSAGLFLWAAPVIAVAVLTGTGSVFTAQGLFFSGTALVTFGGAYAVLAFVAQRAVEVYGWLTPGEMVRGLALAETTPGPLIMVVQFVAFLGAYRDPGALNPWAAGLLGALLTTWVTFVPCFLFIFLGAPHVERLRGNHAISAALTGITAAVVGVIANLALYFALHTLFAVTNETSWGPVQLDLPDLATLRPPQLLIAMAALVMVFRLRWSVLRTLATCAALGLLATLIPLAQN